MKADRRVILAAGESRRMGTAKALLPFREGTFLSHLAATLARRCSPVIAVFGFDATRLMAACPPSVTPVQNRDYVLGMLTSLQAGLRALPAECEEVFFTPVDHPAVDIATLDALLSSPSPVVIPRFNGKRGHPVLLRRAIAHEFLSAAPSSKVHDIIDRHAAEIAYIETGDPGVTDDIDDPALYRDLLRRDAVMHGRPEPR